MTVSPTLRSVAGPNDNSCNFFVVLMARMARSCCAILGENLGDDLGVVRQDDADLVAAGNDVAIGDDEAALVDDDAGAHDFVAAPVALTFDLDGNNTVVRLLDGFGDGCLA